MNNSKAGDLEFIEEFLNNHDNLKELSILTVE